MNESEFSKTLTQHWRKMGYMVQRVETGQITRGVPDLFVANKAGYLWVELKSVKFNPYNGMCIPWRPGQQGWMLEHLHSTGRPCYTIVHHPSCIAIIPMTKRFAHNLVALADIQTVKSVKDITL